MTCKIIVTILDEGRCTVDIELLFEAVEAERHAQARAIEAQARARRATGSGIKRRRLRGAWQALRSALAVLPRRMADRRPALGRTADM
jgi:hypothetical protein